MNKSYIRIVVVIETILMLIVSISLGYVIGQTKREVYQKENEIQELKKEFRNYKKQ